MKRALIMLLIAVMIVHSFAGQVQKTREGGKDVAEIFKQSISEYLSYQLNAPGETNQEQIKKVLKALENNSFAVTMGVFPDEEKLSCVIAKVPMTGDGGYMTNNEQFMSDLTNAFERGTNLLSEGMYIGWKVSLGIMYVMDEKLVFGTVVTNPETGATERFNHEGPLCNY